MKIISMHNGHDSSITAMEDGKILYHWELERHIYKAKHFAGFHNKNILAEFLRCHALPMLLWKEEEIDVICLGGLDAGWVGSTYEESEFKECINDRMYGKELEEPYILWDATWGKKKQKFFASVHHVNHMAYSYYTSPFNKALLFAYDGEGDFNTTTTYGIGKGNKVEYTGNLTTHPHPKIEDNRFGVAYNKLGIALPFFGNDLMATPGKAMGYSSYGKVREEWKQHILNAIKTGNIEKLVKDINLPSSLDSHDETAMDFMSTFQKTGERYILDTLQTIIEETGIDNICLSGGCALNVLINSRIRNELTDQLYVPPACSDTGQSLGAALYFWHHILKNKFEPMSWHNPYLGDRMQNLDLIDFYLRQHKNIYKNKFNNQCEMIEFVSSLLKNDKIIGWAQGRSEIGPRALGNRSILCLPAKKEMKDLINDKVKHREWWRPFAPVCIAEDVEDWFETKHEHPYMLESLKVRKDKIFKVPAIVHEDQTSRVQTVSKNQNKVLYDLLMSVKKKTGIPILLNTSLNDRGKPIANNSKAVLDLLANTDLDYAVIENNVFGKIKSL